MKTRYLTIILTCVFLMIGCVSVQGWVHKDEIVKSSSEDDWEQYYDIRYDDGNWYGICFKILSEDDLTLMVIDPIGYVTDSGGYSGKVIVPATVDYEGKTYTVTECATSAFFICQIVYLDLPATIRKLNTIDACYRLENIVLHEGLEEMDGAITGCHLLKGIDLPCSLKRINKSLCDTGLERINIPEGTEVVESCNDNPNLSIVELPAGELSIKDSFNGCPAVSRILVHAETPCEFPSDSFIDVDRSRCLLYVPDESVDLYRRAYGWSSFYIRGLSTSGVAEVSGSPETEEYYTIDGVRLDSPADGLTIVRNGSKVTKRICR